MTDTERAAVAVIGGGPAGASAALALARRGFDTVVLEWSDGCGHTVGECLAPAANALLERIGLVDLLTASGAVASYGNRSLWGGDGQPVDRDFLREPFGCGWHLDRATFNAALLARIETAGVRVWRRTRVEVINRGEGFWRIGMETAGAPHSLLATMLVDASGRQAVVARRRRVRRRIFDTLVAAVAVLEQDPRGEALRDATTAVEAVESGWWYAALLPARRLVVTWFTDPDLLRRGDAMHAVGWWDLLQRSELVGDLVRRHRFLPPERIRLAPAGSSLLARPTGEGWLAAGDAAAAYDPLSSHGIASALAGGAAAGRAIVSLLDGDGGAAATYTDRLFADYARYLWDRRAYYAAETRWPDAPFWRRRAAPG